MQSYNKPLLIPASILILMALTHSWWETHMFLHMAGQIPLLAILGGMLAMNLSRAMTGLDVLSRRYRSSLLLFALFTLGAWMLPRLLDAALYETDMALLKWLSLPLAGAALALCWPHLPVILRAVLHLEAIATLLRLGSLYLLAPQSYCVSYGQDEQQVLGYMLMGYGSVYAVYLGWGVMFGGHRTDKKALSAGLQE